MGLKCKDIYDLEINNKMCTVKEIETFTIEMFKEWMHTLKDKHYDYLMRTKDGVLLAWEKDDRDVCFVTCKMTTTKILHRTIEECFPEHDFKIIFFIQK